MATAVDDLRRFHPALSPRDLEQSFESSLVKVAIVYQFIRGNTQGSSTSNGIAGKHARLLEQMNSQFVMNQNAFNDYTRRKKM